MSFKKGRKTLAEKNREEKRMLKREQDRKELILSNMVSTAIRMSKLGFFPPALPKEEEVIGVHEIGLFRFSILNPTRDLRGVREKFSVETEYGLFAPFRDEILFELYTNRELWKDRTFDDRLFTEWDSEEQLKILQGFSDVILFLFRVRGFTVFSAPFDISGSTLGALKHARNSSVSLRTRMKESLLDAMHLPNSNPRMLGKKDIDWVNKFVLQTYQRNMDSVFNFLFEIYESLHYPNPAVQLTQIWAGVEFIVRSSNSRVGRSIKARCAMILGTCAQTREEIFSNVGKLYSFRSSIIHGTKPLTMSTVLQDIQENEGELLISGGTKMLYDSFKLLNNLVKEVITRDPVFFSKDELNKLEDAFSKSHPRLFNA